ncbi:MAG TPA: biotin-dependent carboxyltransferase family protein [Burkholderiales bacterium]|nr:biotin-dependent carboxyltransferase family protein [Burkholderiales bacterium]
MSVRILRPGILMTVQDGGRHGYQHLGLCPGGAMDPVALALANALVGNEVDDAALEITVLGPDLEFGQDTLVALCGAEFEASLPLNRPVLVEAGKLVHIGRAMRGARGYLAIAGGVALEPVLGSRSTYLPGQFGGYEGRTLRRGDKVPLQPAVDELSRERFAKLKGRNGRTVRWWAPPLTAPDREPILLHVIEGEHYGRFDGAAQRAFLDTIWTIAPDSNRMGFRLGGAPLARTVAADGSDEILSAPTALGSVQVPANGQPIVLMADHQTTGGYPRIAEIAWADVPRLAQLAPGGRLHFARCSLEIANQLRKAMRERLDSALHGIAWEYGA